MQSSQLLRNFVLGELMPKAVALLYPEHTARWVSGPLVVFTVATNPFIWILNGTANGLLKLIGVRAPHPHERVHSPEEIKMLIAQSEQVGQIDPEAADVLERVFEFSEKTAIEVMTPRTDIVGLSGDLTVREAAEAVAQAGRSRYPVYIETIDDVVGIAIAKDILRALQAEPDKPLQHTMRQAVFVPGTRGVEDLLADMKRMKVHMSIVLDEYGGTAGLVTMEDLLEELVGQIYDEYDTAEEAGAEAGEHGPVVPGQMELDEVNERFGIELHDDHYQTIGGYVFGRLGRIPKPGDRISVSGGALEVVEMEGRRVGQVRYKSEH